MIVLCLIDGIKIVSGLLTPIIAIIAVYIAYQQYLINKRKLKLDLYERRFRIFDETKKVLHKINQYAKIDLIELRDFMFSTNDRIFLFDSDINELIIEIKNKAIDLNHSTDDLKNEIKLPVGSNERKVQIENNTTLTHWFTSEFQNIEYRFLKYLDFKKL